MAPIEQPRIIERVLWDYDDTLGNSEKIALAAACNLTNRWLAERGVKDVEYEQPRFKETFVGHTFRQIVERIAGENSLALSPGELDGLVRRELDGAITALTKELREVDYASDTLAQLRGCNVLGAVVSSSAPPRLAACLRTTGQEIFFKPTDVFSVQDPDQPSNPKPAPDIYFRAMRELELTAAQCVAVEDSGGGVKSASQAGLDVFGFVGLHEPTKRAEMAEKLFGAGARWIISSLSQVASAVKLINAGRINEVDRIYGRDAYPTYT